MTFLCRCNDLSWLQTSLEKKLSIRHGTKKKASQLFMPTTPHHPKRRSGRGSAQEHQRRSHHRHQIDRNPTSRITQTGDKGENRNPKTTESKGRIVPETTAGARKKTASRTLEQKSSENLGAALRRGFLGGFGSSSTQKREPKKTSNPREHLTNC